MSDAKTLIGIFFIFGLLALLLGSMAVGTCTEQYKVEFPELPAGGWLPQLDAIIAGGQYILGIAGLMFNPCSDMFWIATIIMIPLGLGLLYLVMKVVKDVIPFT